MQLDPSVRHMLHDVIYIQQPFGQGSRDVLNSSALTKLLCTIYFALEEQSKCNSLFYHPGSDEHLLIERFDHYKLQAVHDFNDNLESDLAKRTEALKRAAAVKKMQQFNDANVSNCCF